MEAAGVMWLEVQDSVSGVSNFETYPFIETMIGVCVYIYTCIYIYTHDMIKIAISKTTEKSPLSTGGMSETCVYPSNEANNH